MAQGFPPSGSIFFKDIYSQLYNVEWETILHDGLELLDFTTVVKIPYVWGQIDEGFIKDKQVFRRGICMTQRQIFAPAIDGYEIVAEGESAIICIFQSTFSCGTAPTDPFRHHLDQALCDQIEGIVACGPRFADPAEPNDDEVLFSEISLTGAIVEIPCSQPFQFVDVWKNDETLTAVCNPGDITDCTSLFAWCDLTLPEWSGLSVFAWSDLAICDF